MCGIAGYWDFSAATQRDALVLAANAMTSALRHRGPDDGAIWVDAGTGIVLGHRRLSILDLSDQGRQPMRSASGRYVVTYNGEIYNFLELRGRLEAQGFRFRSSSDTEVLLAACEAWGLEAALQAFNGMFAFALWDSQERCLYLARDRAGEKPLYWHRASGSFAFASELKALDAGPTGLEEIDADAVALFARHAYIPAPYCIHRGVAKLPPACWMKVRRGVVSEPSPYWSAKQLAEGALSSPLRTSAEEAREQLDALLRDAVRLRMAADVPLGAFLSGGLDSSTIVSLMQAQSARPVRTFTIGFHENDFNEAHRARQVARHLGAEHVELYLSSEQALEVVPRLPGIYDEPFADSSQIPTLLVSELARRYVTVSLSGDGGDELFGGYKMYRAMHELWRWMHRTPISWRRRIASAIRGTPVPLLDLVFGPVQAVQQRYGRAGSMGDKLLKLASILTAEHPESMYGRLISSHQPGGPEPAGTPFTDSMAWLASPDVIPRIMYLDIVTYLPGDILVKLDRASMSVGLEARVPFLDPRVMEFAWRLPMDMKIRGRQSKWILRQVLNRYVPNPLIRRSKAGFSIPLASWLRGPLRDWADSLLSGHSIRQTGFFDPRKIQCLWSEHCRGARNWERPLWQVLMFQAWLDSRRPASKVNRNVCSLTA